MYADRQRRITERATGWAEQTDRVFLGQETWRGRTLPVAALGRLPMSTDQSGQRIGRVAIQVVARPVVSPRRPRVRVPSRVLDVSEAGTSVQAEGHKRVA